MFFLQKNGFLATFTGEVKSGVINPPYSESGVITSLRVNFSSKSTAMGHTHHRWIRFMVPRPSLAPTHHCAAQGSAQGAGQGRLPRARILLGHRKVYQIGCHISLTTALYHCSRHNPLPPTALTISARSCLHSGSTQSNQVWSTIISFHPSVGIDGTGVGTEQLPNTRAA